MKFAMTLVFCMQITVIRLTNNLYKRLLIKKLDIKKFNMSIKYEANSIVPLFESIRKYLVIKL